VSFGGGVGHFSESNQLNYFGTNLGGSSTTGVIQAGLGLDVIPEGFQSLQLSRQGSRFLFPVLLISVGRYRQDNDSIIISSGLAWSGISRKN
jgi:hypothetical protein